MEVRSWRLLVLCNLSLSRGRSGIQRQRIGNQSRFLLLLLRGIERARLDREYVIGLFEILDTGFWSSDSQWRISSSVILLMSIDAKESGTDR